MRELLEDVSSSSWDSRSINNSSEANDEDDDDTSHDKEHYCIHIFPYIPIPGTHLDLLLLIGVGLYLLMAIITLIFIQYGKYLGNITNSSFSMRSSPSSSSTQLSPSIIFPIFEYLLYLQAFISLLTGIIIALLPVRIGTTNQLSISLTYALIFTLQHFLIEGFAILLQQHGCGTHALSLTIFYDSIWAILCFCLYFIFFEGKQYSLLGQGILDLALFIYYGALTFLPQSIIYRRPSLLIYAKYWFILRLFGTLLHLGFLVHSLEDYASCGYYFYRIILFCVFQPFLSYQVLLIDSQWWQGLSPNPINPNDDYDFEFSLTSAHTLAEVMDQLNSIPNVIFLNYTTVKFHADSLLGDGSFSQVVKGMYKDQPVAIKTIYTYDLTTEIIYKLASETKILYLLRNSPHVVSIYGLILLPPSICIVLEYCQYGSLNNVLRGFEVMSAQQIPESDALNAPLYSTSLMKNQPSTLCLSVHDMLHLALGAAKGVHAVHSFSPFLCHRDIKSFNFLVDSNFLVKIADLELGDDRKSTRQRSNNCCNLFSSSLHPEPSSTQPSSELEEGLVSLNLAHESTSINSHDPENTPFQTVHPSVLEMQATWLAPEVITTGIFTQAADIYSLALVLWEIRTKRYPYTHCNYLQTEIRNCVLSGFRESFPLIAPHDLYGKTLQEYDDLIRICWQADPLGRLKSGQIVDKLEQLVKNVVVDCLETVQNNHLHHEMRMSGIRSPTTGRILGLLDVGIGGEIDENSSNSQLSVKENEEDPQVHQLLHTSRLKLSNFYQLMESQGGEWIIVSNDPHRMILFFTSSFRRATCNVVPSLFRNEFDFHHLQRENNFLTMMQTFTKQCELSPPNTSILDSLAHFFKNCTEFGYSHMTITSPTVDSIQHQQLYLIHGYLVDLAKFQIPEENSTPDLSSPTFSPSSPLVLAILFSKLSPSRPSSSRTPSRTSFQAINTLFGNLVRKSSMFSQRSSGVGSGHENESEPFLRESKQSLDSVDISDSGM